jgi:hypothetical protein
VAVVDESRDELVLRIGPLERLALERLSGADPGHRESGAVAVDALRDGLLARLTAAGLPSPYADAPIEPQGGEQPGPPQTGWDRVRGRREIRALVAIGSVAALAVVLAGGYGYGWRWTGLADNRQVWDWLRLLLLPVAFGTFALWLRHGIHMSRTRRLTLASAVVASGIFVAAGYLVPLNWTGFKGNTLWDWQTLLLLPLALTAVRLWPSTAREIGGGHVALLLGLALALLIALVGGYVGGWSWTGYPGNTLWDWVSLVLGPVVIARYVIPAAVRWVSGDVERVAREGREPLSR